ncbi:MAG: hypothetical protein WAP35_09255 [Solirubrobacterales bacterium]
MELRDIDTRENHVTTLEEARAEIARIDAAEAERRALSLFKRCQQRDGAAGARQRVDARKASKAEADFAAIVEQLERDAGPETASRIKPFAAYDLYETCGEGRTRVIAVEAGANPGRTNFRIQQAFNQPVRLHRPPYCTGKQLPDFVTSPLAIEPTDDELRVLADA